MTARLIASDIDGAIQAQFTNHGSLLKTLSTANDNTNINVSFTNFGNVNVETGNLQFYRPFTNHGRVITHDGTRLRFFNRVDLMNESDGHLTGSGSYLLDNTAKLINKGSLSPGIDGIGHLTVLGDYLQTETGRLQIELSSLDAFDTLNVQGLVDLGGTLQISGLKGYNPNFGDSFIVMSYLGSLGPSPVFDRIEWNGFDPSLAFAVSYLNNAVTLKVIPLPAGFTLFVSGLMLLGVLRNHAGLQPKTAV